MTRTYAEGIEDAAKAVRNIRLRHDLRDRPDPDCNICVALGMAEQAIGNLTPKPSEQISDAIAMREAAAGVADADATAYTFMRDKARADRDQLGAAVHAAEADAAKGIAFAIRTLSTSPSGIEDARVRMLGEALGKVLVHVGMVREGAPMTGPELLCAAETYLQSPRESASSKIGGDHG